MNLSQAGGILAVAGFGAGWNGGTIVFLSGTQPATPETALSGNTTLATATLASTAFPTAPTYASGYVSASASFSNASPTAAATGTVSFARVYKSDGTTVLCDLTVGTSGSVDVTVPSLSTTSGTAYPVASMTVKMPVT